MKESRRIWCICTSLFMGFSLLIATGCSNVLYVKRNVKGPIFRDSLRGTSEIAVIDGGTFCKTGWSPGKEGSLTYDLPALPQGMVSLDISNLSRTGADSIFLTLYEPTDSRYAEPFITKNPYLIHLSVKNYLQSPESPFDFLWTIKNFPVGTVEKDRYIEGIPSNVQGDQQQMAAKAFPIFPSETYRVQIKWRLGKVQLIVNNQVLAEHTYAPVLFGAKSLRMVIGKSPVADSFNLPDIVVSNVWVSYPSIYEG